jgi:hypothetical protein
MRPVHAVPARWLRLCVAVLALLAGSGVHAALHAPGAHGDARPTSPFEAHGAGCEHLGDEAPHGAGSCVQCKLGGAHAATLRAHTARLAPPRRDGCLDRGRVLDRADAPVPGPLGARAPPVTVG